MLNKIMLIGNVGNTPEVKYTGSGTAYATFSVATTKKYTDKSGATQSQTTWHNVKCFGKKAEVVGKYVTKGMKIYIEGEQHHEKAEKDGVTKYYSYVMADSFEFLQPKEQESSGLMQENIPF